MCRQDSETRTQIRIIMIIQGIQGVERDYLPFNVALVSEIRVDCVHFCV